MQQQSDSKSLDVESSRTHTLCTMTASIARMNGTPTTVGGSNGVTSFSAAVNRSSELLSCGKSSVRLLQQKQQQTGENACPYESPNAVQLSPFTSNPPHAESNSTMYQEDAMSLLRTMKEELSQLEKLVRQTGQTNDPTSKITAATQRFERDAQDLSTLLQQLERMRYTSGQAQKHMQLVVEWFTTQAQNLASELQGILKIRAKVLQQQAKRRQQFSSQATSTSISKTKASSALENNPLFAQQPSIRNRQPKQQQQHHPNNDSYTTNGGSSTTTAASSTPSLTNKTSYYGNGNVAGSAPSYYSSTSTSTMSSPSSGGYGGMGMRQRRAGAAPYGKPRSLHPDMIDDDERKGKALPEQDQLLVQSKVPKSNTTRRLHEVRQAEQALASIGQLFGKMSQLVQQQAEVVVSIEDDVEAASLDVQAGHEEIGKVYNIKKGNRALILKVFGLLIFLIIFMRIYKK